MKKLSILCILAILCTFFASCADPVKNTGDPAISAGSETATSVDSRNPDSVAVSTASSAVQTTKSPATTSPEAGSSAPEVDGPEISYNPFQDPASYSLLTLPVVCGWLSVLEEYGNPGAICLVTFEDIDFSLVPDDNSYGVAIPITVRIDKILEKNILFSKSEGEIISTIDSASRWGTQNGVITVTYPNAFFPIAEIGKQYIVIFLGDPSVDIFDLTPLSVPLPSEQKWEFSYFIEKMRSMGLNESLFSFQRDVLEKWFYPYLASES